MQKLFFLFFFFFIIFYFVTKQKLNNVLLFISRKIYSSLEKDKTGVILSTDNYFNMNGSHYQYDSTKLPGAHAWNKSQGTKVILK